VTPFGLLVLVGFGFHKASEGSDEFKSLAYPALGVALIVGFVLLILGGVEAKQYCDELWEGQTGGDALDYAAAHCSTLWPKP